MQGYIYWKEKPSRQDTPESEPAYFHSVLRFLQFGRAGRFSTGLAPRRMSVTACSTYTGDIIRDKRLNIGILELSTKSSIPLPLPSPEPKFIKRLTQATLIGNCSNLFTISKVHDRGCWSVRFILQFRVWGRETGLLCFYAAIII